MRLQRSDAHRCWQAKDAPDREPVDGARPERRCGSGPSGTLAHEQSLNWGEDNGIVSGKMPFAIDHGAAYLGMPEQV